MTTVNLDSQMLTAIQTCPMKYNLSFNEHLASIERPEPLERGDLLHKLMEIYQVLKNELSLDRDIFQLLDQAGFGCPNGLDRNKAVQFALSTANFFASQMQLEPDTVEETTFHFAEYCKYMENDPWKVLDVEAVGSKILFESEDLRIIYTVKMDLIVERSGIIAPMDHKTSRRRSDPTSMNNQFMGYCWFLNTDHAIVNKIGFQKTVAPKDRFQRDLLVYTPRRIAEWVTDTVHWVKLLLVLQQQNVWPMSKAACKCPVCTMRCQYHDLCESSPENREDKKFRLYTIREPWDPAKGLEEHEAIPH